MCPLIARSTSSAVGIRLPFQKRRRAHRHARGAEAALHRVVLDKGFLDRVKLIAAREPLDGGDSARPDLDGERHAGADRRSVQPDRAGRARAAITGDLRSRETERPPQNFGERGARLDFHRSISAVYIENDLMDRTAGRRRSLVGGGARDQGSRSDAHRHIRRSAQKLTTRQFRSRHDNPPSLPLPAGAYRTIMSVAPRRD